MRARGQVEKVAEHHRQLGREVVPPWGRIVLKTFPAGSVVTYCQLVPLFLESFVKVRNFVSKGKSRPAEKGSLLQVLCLYHLIFPPAVRNTKNDEQ